MLDPKIRSQIHFKNILDQSNDGAYNLKLSKFISTQLKNSELVILLNFKHSILT